MKDKIPPFPISRPTLEEAKEDFNKLIESKVDIKQGRWKARGGVVGSDYIGIDRTGIKVSNHYHWFARMACDSINSPSAMRSWYSKQFRKGIENSQFYEKNPASALALRKYIPSQFRPAAAKILLEHFKVQRWYDPCGGWGDRLCAAQATGVEYHCRDVNPLVFSGYSAQQEEYGGNVSFEYKGAEEDAPEKDYFDFVFTSPPYWKQEKYMGKEQSFLKYKGFENWRDGFLLPMMENAWDSLSRNGVFAINISNVYANHTENDLFSPVHSFITRKTHDFSMIGYQIPKRPGEHSSKHNKEKGVFAEPVLIGVKGG